MIDAAALHRAAERVGTEYGTPAMDAIAAAGAEFIHTSDLADEHGTPFIVRDPQALGYGIMLGYLAAVEAGERVAKNMAIAVRLALDAFPEPWDESDERRAVGIGALRGALDRYERHAAGFD